MGGLWGFYRRTAVVLTRRSVMLGYTRVDSVRRGVALR
jgi:hypothetical protein